MQQQINFLLGFDRACQSLNQLLDWRNHSRELFVRVVHQNNNTLSRTKKESRYSWIALADDLSGCCHWSIGSGTENEDFDKRVWEKYLGYWPVKTANYSIQGCDILDKWISTLNIYTKSIFDTNYDCLYRNHYCDTGEYIWRVKRIERNL